MAVDLHLDPDPEPEAYDETRFEEGADWKLRASLVLTIVWLALGAFYISGVVGWMGFVQQRAPDLGSFLEGAFAPLAFLWLVVGFFLQRQQLADNTSAVRAQLYEMRRTAEQSEVQSRAIAADELHSRQDTFMRVAEMVNEQLGTIAGFLVTSKLTELDDESPDGPDGWSNLWAAMGLGDHSAFNRKVFGLVFGGKVTPEDLFWGTEIRANHSRRFIHAFERLVEHARRCDPDGIIADALLDGSHGRMYKQITEAREAG